MWFERENEGNVAVLDPTEERFTGPAWAPEAIDDDLDEDESYFLDDDDDDEEDEEYDEFDDDDLDDLDDDVEDDDADDDDDDEL